ncbi:MAG TPA: phosphate acetyltransferase [Thermomicrobiales bacterium]|nr:phosphate acetyltransferase [Thermomicrobiales bacterium]
MPRNIYITSAEGHTGKSTVALGLLTLLKRSARNIGVYRPVSRSRNEPDHVLNFLLSQLDRAVLAAECIGVTYEDVHTDPEGALTQIITRYKAMEHRHDVVIILGSDYTDVSSPTELRYNARIAANLGAPVLLVLGGRSHDETASVQSHVLAGQGRTASEMYQTAEVALTELQEEHAQLVAVIANRVDPDILEEVTAAVKQALHPSGAIPVWSLPDDPVLVAPTLAELSDMLDGHQLKGDPELLHREVLAYVISGMSMENILVRLTEGAAVVVAGDRSEVLLAILMAHSADTFPQLSGIILNGGFSISPTIERLISGIGTDLPIVSTDLNTFETALRITRARGQLTANSQRKIDVALSLFDEHVDEEALISSLEMDRASVVTPLMFEYQIIDRARSDRKRIVLPEGDDDRILRAASTLLQRHAAELTILGDKDDITTRAARLDLDLSSARIVSPHDPALVERFAEEYARLRAHKGMTIAKARHIITDVSYFGTMMVHMGLADGMVSGAAHTTAHTIKPSFEIIKTSPDVSVVSSVFFMCLEDRVLVYGDCAVNPNPTAEQLADIAISSARTAARFGVEPRIAMLSYSTGESGAGDDVERVRTATRLVRERRPDLLVEGPIQYDAATDASVAAAKMPDSSVAGRATVFIFPDLNTGNNTYKAVQRSAGAVAIGPVLQGLRKPINDLSRGALVKDIVNTVAITVIQAQGEGEPA